MWFKVLMLFVWLLRLFSAAATMLGQNSCPGFQALLMLLARMAKAAAEAASEAAEAAS